ncbi:hypothetical protein C5167_049345 [Papaver somniferum]|uniref:Uncharacterized protein n=1 Tax=Papaver somniferum TaxID=3469 RepID=A0A4Y7KLY4_PAPSO|nr:hypothetical protein C5167_049345 [Papaver somniferum]
MILIKFQLKFRFTIRFKSFYASLSFPSLSVVRNLWKKISKQTDLYMHENSAPELEGRNWPVRGEAGVNDDGEVPNIFK